MLISDGEIKNRSHDKCECVTSWLGSIKQEAQSEGQNTCIYQRVIKFKAMIH